MLYEFEFEGRRPSYKQVKACAIKAIKEGYPLISILWGENWISLENNLGEIRGRGWIKNIGGDDLANELNQNGGAL
jgi:hypothetical protein